MRLIIALFCFTSARLISTRSTLLFYSFRSNRLGAKKFAESLPDGKFFRANENSSGHFVADSDVKRVPNGNLSSADRCFDVFHELII